MVHFVRHLIIFIHNYSQERSFLVWQLQVLDEFLVDLDDARNKAFAGNTSRFHDSAFDIVSAARGLSDEDLLQALTLVRDIQHDFSLGRMSQWKEAV